MSRIDKVFNRLRDNKEKALIPYIMAGDPDLKKTEKLILEIEKAGAHIIELGVPFSDPLADGPTIQKASDRSLACGTSLRKVLSLVKRVRRRCDIPIVLMTYYNPIFRYGETQFTEDAVTCGVDGVIVPDLPPEEGSRLIKAARKSGIDIIFLLAPTSTDERIKKISRLSKGFIYYVSLTGVTGMRKNLAEDLRSNLERIKGFTDKPIAVGFGVSTPKQVTQASRWADGVVVGSAIVNLVEKNVNNPRLAFQVRDFVRKLKKGLAH